MIGEVNRDECTLRTDREIVMISVSQNGLAVQCASVPLRDDRNIGLTAVRQNGNALKYVAENIAE